MLVDDRPSHPMVSFLEVGLLGEVDGDCLRLSGEQVLERHPLMAARVAGRRMRDWHWVPANHPLRIKSISSPEQLPPIGAERMNLWEESGLRVWVLVQPGRTRLFLQVHHAVADALGMLTFLLEWLTLYAQLQSTSRVISPLPPPTVDRLRKREDLTGLKSPYPRRVRWKGIAKVFLGKPIALLKTHSPSPPATTELPDLPGHCVASVSTDQIQELKRQVRGLPATVGDRLLQALFETLVSWNGADETAALRVVVPVNRRSDEESLLSAANKISYKYVSRTVEELVNRQDSLKSIAAEMEFVRRHRRSIFNFLKTLKVLEKLGLMHRVLYGRRSFGTVVFSNLGDLNKLFAGLLPEVNGRFVAGNLTLDSLACAPPRRPQTHTTIVSFSYAGRLVLCSRGDGRGLDAVPTQQFLNEMLARLIQGFSPCSADETRDSISS